jgi:branched-chain amino acid transport system substrate-binding protein
LHKNKGGLKMYFLRRENRYFKLFLILVLVLTIGISGCSPKEKTEEIKGEEPIVLGVLGSLEYSHGDGCLKSVQMAAAEINKAGGVKVGEIYRPIEVVSMDTRDLEPGIPLHDALAAVEKLLTEKKPHALLVGPTRSEVMLAAMDMVADYKIPHLITIPFTMELPKRLQENYESYKYYFRLCPDAMYIGWLCAQGGLYAMEELGKGKTAHLVYQDTIANAAAAAGIKAIYESAGVTVTGFDPYPLGASDFSASVSNAIRNGTAVLHVSADGPEFGILVKQAISMDYQGLVLGYITPMGHEDSWDVYDGHLEGMLGFSLQMGNIPVKANPKAEQFYYNYGEMWGEKARKEIDLHGPAPSYDAVYVLADAFERAAAVEGDELLEALKKTDIMGAIGRIKFNEKHQVVYGTNYKEEAVGVVFQWQPPGIRVPVYPKNIAEGKLLFPQ